MARKLKHLKSGVIHLADLGYSSNDWESTIPACVSRNHVSENYEEVIGPIITCKLCQKKLMDGWCPSEKRLGHSEEVELAGIPFMETFDEQRHSRYGKEHHTNGEYYAGPTSISGYVKKYMNNHI
jgi:hypothetical protein